MTNLPAAVLARGLEDNPDKIAFALFGPARAERWSYARLQSAITNVAAGLSALGWERGPVAVTLGHGSDAIAAIFGAMAAGFDPVVTASTLPAGHVGVIGDQADSATTLSRATLAAWIDGPPAVPPASAPATRMGFMGSDGAIIWHDTRAIMAAAEDMARDADLSSADRLMWAGRVDGPLSVTLGLCGALLTGATVLLPAAGLAVATLALLMKRHDATVFAAPAHVLDVVSRQPITTLPRLRHGVNWGEPLPPATATLWQDKTGTPLRDLARPATTDDLAAFAVAALEGVTEATTLQCGDGRTVIAYAGSPDPDTMAAGPQAAGHLWQHDGPLPRDADGRIDHHILINAMESAR